MMHIHVGIKNHFKEIIYFSVLQNTLLYITNVTLYIYSTSI